MNGSSTGGSSTGGRTSIPANLAASFIAKILKSSEERTETPTEFYEEKKHPQSYKKTQVLQFFILSFDGTAEAKASDDDVSRSC